MFEPNKSLGQNFLNDQNVVNTMIAQLDLGQNEEIIEIGSGLGAVTDILVDRIGDSSNHLLAVEIDDRFIPRMEKMYGLEPNVTVVQDDILQWLPTYQLNNPDQMTKMVTSTQPLSFKIIGSLPFYITSPILHAIMKKEILPKIVVLLIHKEVAQKISAGAPDASYMSSFVQTFFDVTYVCDVPRQKFNPVPEVDGGVITLKMRNLQLSLDIKRKYEGFLHRAFSNPRKMLNKIFSKEELSKVVIEPTLRAQNITPEKWYYAFNKLCF